MSVRPAQYIEFRAPGQRGWLARGQHAVISWTDAVAGDRLERTGQPDEYAILMYSGSAPVRVTAGSAVEDGAHDELVVTGGAMRHLSLPETQSG